jgi:Tfp pilus assembly major pilin PilA
MIVVGALIVVIAIAGAVSMKRWFAPSAPDRRPNLVEAPPLAPVSRSSVIVMPAAIALSAIQEALEKAAPRDSSGKPEIPAALNPFNTEIDWSLVRGPFAVSGRPDAIELSTALRGSFRVSGQMPTPPGGFSGLPGIPGLQGLFGGGQGRPGTQNPAERTSDQRAEIAGNIVLTARPTLLPGWRLEPNLASRVTIGDASISMMGTKLNLSQEMKPNLERTINEQVASLQAWVRNSPLLEESARREWQKMCRSIPLGAAAGLPNLWIEFRPTRALAAQPRIDATALTLTLGVQAETRIIPNETKPDCPFPRQLELIPQMEQGRVSIDLPVDVPFTEISRLLEAQLKGKTFPEDKSGGVTATIRTVNLAASGDRLLMSLGITANETKSWFGLSADATIHVWGRPVLDPGRQVLRFDSMTLDVDSEAAFGVLGVAARAAVPYLERTLAQNAVVDLVPLAANARKSIEAAIADFRKNTAGVRVDAAVIDLRLSDIEFDAKTLRVIAEADGTVRVAITTLP